MKREGRQHGTVRTYPIIPSPWNPRPKTRYVNQLDYPPTAGIFTKVSSKPTNHSKFTGNCRRPRCSGCRLHPVQKAKNKTKGSYKLKSRYFLDACSLVVFDEDGDDQPPEVTDFEVRVEDIHRHHHDGDDRVVNVTEIESIVEDVPQHVDDEDKMSYCDVEFFVDETVEGDDIWCLVEQRPE